LKTAPGSGTSVLNMGEAMESDRSGGADGSREAGRRFPRRIRPSGGYRDLHSFQAATVIYDATVSFCGRFVESRSRTRDQMVQAARSGRQNIAEGSRASATSSQTELRLINVARASLDELLLDYEDYLRQHGHAQWAKDSPEALAVRRVGQRLAKEGDQADRTDRTDPSDQGPLYRPWLASTDPAVVANAMICLIHQANYLLDQQVRALERQFVIAGGYSEQLAAARLRERERRAGKDQAERTDQADLAKPAAPPACPLCGSPMALRTAKKGPRAGLQFWGCASYPVCNGTKPV
jgi:restriction system protein